MNENSNSFFVTTSKAPVTTSVALVTSSLLFLGSGRAGSSPLLRPVSTVDDLKKAPGPTWFNLVGAESSVVLEPVWVSLPLLQTPSQDTRTWARFSILLVFRSESLSPANWGVTSVKLPKSVEVPIDCRPTTAENPR